MNYYLKQHNCGDFLLDVEAGRSSSGIDFGSLVYVCLILRLSTNPINVLDDQNENDVTIHTGTQTTTITQKKAFLPCAVFPSMMNETRDDGLVQV